MKPEIKLIKKSGEVLNFPDSFIPQAVKPFNKYQAQFHKIEFQFTINNDLELLSQAEEDDVLQVNKAKYHIVRKSYDHKINWHMNNKKGIESRTEYLILEGVLLK